VASISFATAPSLSAAPATASCKSFAEISIVHCIARAIQRTSRSSGWLTLVTRRTVEYGTHRRDSVFAHWSTRTMPLSWVCASRPMANTCLHGHWITAFDSGTTSTADVSKRTRGIGTRSTAWEVLLVHTDPQAPLSPSSPQEVKMAVSGCGMLAPKRSFSASRAHTTGWSSAWTLTPSTRGS
jgi:hypothetical protein